MNHEHTRHPNEGGYTSPSQETDQVPNVDDMTENIMKLTLNNGVEIPALGLGVFQTPPDETRASVEAALATGYRHIDTAAAYGNELEVGEAIHGSGLARDEDFIETKIWISDYGYDETLHGFEKSAAKLGVDHLTSLLEKSTVVPAVNQIELHPYFQQRPVRASAPSTASSPRRGRPSAASPSTATGTMAAPSRTR
jgi:diketogulonate reductase-like aldo/keto reductase